MSQTNVLEANSLGFAYGNRSVFEGMNLAVQRGEILGVLGPNGAGKTTLIKCLVGALSTQRGSIHLFGTDVTRWPLWRRSRSTLRWRIDNE